MSYVGIILTLVFVNNVVLSQLLGLCPLVSASRRVESAAILGFAVTFVSSLAALATWAVERLVLLPLDIGYFRIVAFVLTTVGLVRLLDFLVLRTSSSLRASLQVYLPLLVPNCAVLGITLIAERSGYGALESFVAGAAAGAGFLVSILLLASIREKLESEWVPRPLRGLPIALISAGLIALAFLAFDKALVKNLIG